MQSNFANQQHLYQQHLLQQQQRQMSQFQYPASMDSNVGQVQSPMSYSTPSQPPMVMPTPSTPRNASTRMGPPTHLGQSSSGTFSTPQQLAHASTSESTSYFGPGAGLARLHQYSEALKEAPTGQSSEYWRSVVDEFFLPHATMHLVLWNPSTQEQKPFEVPASVVARWMQTNYISGVISTSLSMESPREYMSGQPFPPPPRSIRADFHLPSGGVTHFVECKRCLYINQFDNGWQVQMTALLRAAFVPHTRVLPLSSAPSNSKEETTPVLQTHLRLECLELLVNNHRSYIPSTASIVKSLEERIPKAIVRNILIAHGHHPSNSLADEKESKFKSDNEASNDEEGKSDFTVKVNQVSLPESPVNEYGITLRAMRCLEITESVCQLRDLMEFSMKEKERHLGPIDGLRRLTAQYRERDGSGGRQGSSMNNALQFDLNATSTHQDDLESKDFATRTKGQQQQQQQQQQQKQQQQQQQSSENNSAALGGAVEAGPAPSPKVGDATSPSKRPR